ncbi:MAG: hypothetical protein LAT54_09045 [Cryomorphaceae bacterium]|nr:hypothetical protein [Cryomorphaceae bacterium]
MRYSLILLLFVPCLIFAQKKEKEEKIIYFTDSKVKRSRISLATDGAGYYSNRNRLGEGFNPGGSAGDETPSTNGTFAWNAGGHIIFSLNRSLELWTGVVYATAGWTDRHFEFQDMRTTMRANLEYINVPIQFSFHSQINEILDLEVLPMLEVNLLSSYNEVVYERNTNTLLSETNMADDPDARDINYTIGLSISANIRFADNWSVYVRPFFHYMLNSLIDDSDRPRDVLIGAGLGVGLRYKFN